MALFLTHPQQRILLAEEPGATPPPGGADPTPPPPPAAINLDVASKFVTENGGFVFGSQGDLDTHIKNNVGAFETEAKKSIYTKVDSNIEKVFGIARNENEVNEAYLKRVSEAYKDNVLSSASGDSNAEINAAKKLTQSANARVEELQGTIERMKADAFNTSISGEINNAFGSANLQYQGVELSAIKRELNSQLSERYEYKNDERGIMVVDRKTGNVELDVQGNRKTPQQVATDFMGKVDGLKFGDTSRGGGPATIPNGTGGALSKAEIEIVEGKLNEFANENGLYGHEKAYWEHAKTLGLEVPKHLVEKWNL